MDNNQFCSIVDLIERSFRKSGDRIAVVEDCRNYTYSELEQMSKLAESVIIKKNIAQKNIALYMNKSIKFISLVIAIWKTGGAYIPLDTEMPGERIDYIIKDAKVDCVIADEFSKYIFKCEQICIDDFFINSDTLDSQDVKMLNGNETAYIIYTSGTTGNPKGVQVSNNNLVSFMLAMNDCIKLTKEDRWLSVTTVCFDISIFEMFFPIINGITLIIGKKRLLIDMNMLREVIIKEKITIMQATPVTWKLLISSNIKALNGVKVLCGGDKLDENLAIKLYEEAKEVWNLYGPTETTIWSSVNKLQFSKDISIGNPISGTNFFLFDSQMRLNESEGELYIGGLGVSKGYINNPKLTNERYIKNPLNIDDVIYKTGDYVKYCDGKYYFLGRNDFQIKLNGHRIEIEDIEKNMLYISGIENAVVIPNSEKKCIFGFVKVSDNDINETYIKESLRKKISEYMIPKRIFVIDRIPLTFNNKVDKKKLIEVYIKSDMRSESGSLQEKVKSIWEKYIGEKVDVNTTYKEYLIDSLTITQISAEMERIWDDFSISDIINYETISNIINHKSNFINSNYSKNKRVEKILNEYNLKIEDVKVEKINRIEEMMANFYFLNTNLNYFQDFYIFKLKKDNLKYEDIRKIYEDELKNKEELFCKYIFGKNIKLESKYFKNLIKYEKININDEDELKNIVKESVDEILNINETSMKLKVIIFDSDVYLGFKYPHVRMDEVSFFELANSVLKKIVINKTSSVPSKDLLMDVRILNLKIGNEVKEKLIKDADIYKTQLNNVVEFYVLNAIKRQYIVKTVSYILNTKNKFGNTIDICSVENVEENTMKNYISLKNKFEKQKDNDILISYDDISNNIIGKDYITFEHIENNGFDINVEIYNKDNCMNLIITLKEDKLIDLKQFKNDFFKLLEGKD